MLIPFRKKALNIQRCMESAYTEPGTEKQWMLLETEQAFTWQTPIFHKAPET